MKKGYTDADSRSRTGPFRMFLVGQDVVGIANTGTGKTGGFLIPPHRQSIEGSQARRS